MNGDPFSSINIENVSQEEEDTYILQLISTLADHSRDINLALIMAIKYDKKSICIKLIKHYGCDPQAPILHNKMTSLEYAKSLNKKDIVEIIEAII